MPGFDTGSVMYALNVDFTGNSLTSGSPQVTTNGQLLIGSTATPNIKVGTLTSPLGTLSIGYSSPNITIDLVGGAAAIERVVVQTGTSPVVPASGTLTINGATVAAGTNPVRTDGTGANTLAVEVQISQAIAATDATKIGLAAFNSSQFSVDANGFVSMSSGGFTWNDVTGTSASMAIQNGYLADNAGLVTLTLPATAAQFSVIVVAGRGSGGWKIAQNANQKIIFGSQTSTIGITGSVASTNANDCVYLLATVGGASTTWTILNAVGNITVT